jgi:hypothetical protein
MTRQSRSAILIFGGVVLLSGSTWFLHGAGRGIRVGTAVVSKTLCSGTFVSGVDPNVLYAEAVKPIPGQTQLAKHLSYNVDREARQVTATWWGGFESRAVYHEGYGGKRNWRSSSLRRCLNGKILLTRGTPSRSINSCA